MSDQIFGRMLWVASIVLATLELGGVLDLGWFYVALPILINIGFALFMTCVVFVSAALGDGKPPWRSEYRPAKVPSERDT